MKILLAGVTGFLGRALAAHWAQHGHEVLGLVRRESLQRFTGMRIAGVTPVEYTTIDDFDTILASSQPDVVVNTVCSYGRAGEPASEMLQVNVLFGLRLLEAATTVASTRAFINTATVLDMNTSAYSLSKWQFTQWGEFHGNQQPDGLRFIDVRLQHMYGPGDANSKFTTHVLHSCQNNIPELRLTAGEQLRDFVYIDDVVSAYDAILTNTRSFAAFEAIEVGSGEAPSIRQFVETAHRVTESTTHLQFGAIPYRNNEAMCCVADTTKLESLGWTRRFKLEDGIRMTITRESMQ